MSKQLQLILSVPPGTITATSLGVDGFAWHRSPGSGKYFKGRTIFADLAMKDGKPDFKFLDEGGWRDAYNDCVVALEKAAGGKRTKTGLSNNAFSPTPIEAYGKLYLVKTGGETLELENAGEMARYTNQSDCHDGMSPDQVAAAAGLPPQPRRVPRLYMVFAPVEFILLSTLTPEEYVWYATHRPGKKFRQLLFTELRADQSHLAAEAVFEQARREMAERASKKTKTILAGDCFNAVPFNAWIGYDRRERGGVYAGDPHKIVLWRFPEKIPHNWERAAG